MSTVNKRERIAERNMDFETKRLRTELSFEFMYNYVEAKKPDLLVDFLEKATAENHYCVGKKELIAFFCEKCSEIIKEPESKETVQQKAVRLLKEARAKNTIQPIDSVKTIKKAVA